MVGLVACAAGKDDPVAAAYPDWTGLTAKNRIIGRELCPSDLRHKVAIIVELEATGARILAKPELAFMAKVFARMMAVSAPDFKCKPSEAKKIVQELNKAKKKLAPMKESTTLAVQNGALIIDMKIDDLLPRLEAMAN